MATTTASPSTTVDHLTHIRSPADHHEVIAEADSGTPTVIYLRNDVIPACKAFDPKYEAIAHRYTETGVHFCVMDYNHETSPMFKFGPNQVGTK
ncbi:hypothetical protein LTR62_006298 [Meristemomyces frigidus]|uniref:Thioredoxin domain-containing protein n=1 Tax=Meristemomyces frigidus TaxID=1508187 RepID=A0AAN7YPZ8_9PEZI|nr:hypothetical protein LTR62_006298 [Meristemomyces frigidus]